MRILIILITISSCSSISNINESIANLGEPKTKFITIDTPNCSRATCKLENEEGAVYFLETPNTLNIPQTKSDFSVTCFVEEVQEMDTVNPLTISLDRNLSYLNHPFECPLTEKEVIVMNKLEESYSVSLEPQEDSLADNNNDDEMLLQDSEEEIEKEPVLSDAQLSAIIQIEELYKNRLISEEVYTKELKAIKKQ
tara:strand:+ start:891 stop:1478 length:588 start_codon:yes stop_codon:yes gene_type:complete